MPGRRISPRKAVQVVQAGLLLCLAIGIGITGLAGRDLRLPPEKTLVENVPGVLPSVASQVYYVDTFDAIGVTVEGDWAFVADQTGGIKAINISDPTRPSAPYMLAVSDSALDIVIKGDLAFVANWRDDLLTINVTDPTSMQIVGEWEAQYNDTHGVVAEGDFAYLAHEECLAVLNITDPTNPKEPACSAKFTGSAEKIAVAGNWAYITYSYPGGLAIYNITNPKMPTLASLVSLSGVPVGVCVAGGLAYVATGSSGLAVINMSNPLNPGTPIYRHLSGTATGVCLSGEFAYVASGSSGLAVICIQDPLNPGAPQYVDTAGNAKDVQVVGEYAFIADSFAGLAITRIGKVIVPHTHKMMNQNTENDVVVDGDFCYVLAGGVNCFNVEDPTNPVKLGSVGVGGEGQRMFHTGDLIHVVWYAFGMPSTYGFSIVNVSNPYNPVCIKTVSLASYSTALYVEGDFAYVVDSTYLRVINVTDPATASIVGSLYIKNSPGSVWVEGNYAFIANNTGIAVVNVTQPDKPALTAFVATPGNALNVVADGDYLYVADGTVGLTVIDISDARVPSVVTSLAYFYAWNVKDVWVDGDYAFLSIGTDSFAVLGVIGIHDPRHPQHLFDYTFYNGPPSPLSYRSSVFVTGGWTYVTTAAEMAIFRTMDKFYALSPPVLDQIAPKIDNDGTINLSWSGVAGAVNYSIYRANESIVSVDAMSPVCMQLHTTYQDVNVGKDGTYYYVAIAHGSLGISTESNQVDVEVDQTAPSVTVSDPTYAAEFAVLPPPFTVTATDKNLNATWYSVDGGATNTTFSANGTIDQGAWASLPNGAVNITFAANDTAGNVGFATVTVVKNVPIADYTLYAVAGTALAGMCIVGIAVKVRKRKFAAGLEKEFEEWGNPNEGGGKKVD